MCGEPEFYWKKGASKEERGEVETGGTPCCATLVEKEGEESFPSAELRAPLRVKQSFRARERGGNVPEANFCLNCLPLL